MVFYLLTQLMDEGTHKFGENFGYKIHFSASWGEEFSSSAISRELSTIFSDHVAINSNPECGQCIQKQQISPCMYIIKS